MTISAMDVTVSRCQFEGKEALKISYDNPEHYSCTPGDWDCIVLPENPGREYFKKEWNAVVYEWPLAEESCFESKIYVDQNLHYLLLNF